MGVSLVYIDYLKVGYKRPFLGKGKRFKKRKHYNFPTLKSLLGNGLKHMPNQTIRYQKLAIKRLLSVNILFHSLVKSS